MEIKDCGTLKPKSELHSPLRIFSRTAQSYITVQVFLRFHFCLLSFSKFGPCQEVSGLKRLANISPKLIKIINMENMSVSCNVEVTVIKYYRIP